MTSDFTIQHLCAGDRVRRLHPADGTHRQLQPTGAQLVVVSIDNREPGPVAHLSDGTWDWVSNLYRETT